VVVVVGSYVRGLGWGVALVTDSGRWWCDLSGRHHAMIMPGGLPEAIMLASAPHKPPNKSLTPLAAMMLYCVVQGLW